MAKTKKSRRARRQESEKQRQSSASTPIFDSVEPGTDEDSELTSTETSDNNRQTLRGKAVDFVQEYFYVYTDLGNMIVIAVILFVIMVGLLYLI